MALVGLAAAACGPLPLERSRADAGLIEPFELGGQTVVVEHQRPDLRLEALWVSFYCLSLGEDPAPLAVAHCGELTLDGQPHDGVLEFRATGPDRATTRPVSFRFSRPKDKAFCIGMKVLFEGISNQHDWSLYVTPEDRYSILSYCSEPTLPARHASQPRWAHRREPTFEAFLAALARPISLALKR